MRERGGMRRVQRRDLGDWRKKGGVGDLVKD